MKRSAVVLLLAIVAAVAAGPGLFSATQDIEVQESSELPLKSTFDSQEDDWIVALVKPKNHFFSYRLATVRVDISATIISIYLKNVPVPPPELLSSKF